MKLFFLAFSVFWVQCFGQECQTDDIEKELASLKRELMDLSWNLEDAKMKEDESGIQTILFYSNIFVADVFL